MKTPFFACLLALAVLFTAGSSAKSLVREEENKRTAFYQKALYEACEEMAALQTALKKLSVTGSKAMETEYLSKISGYADSVQNSLSALPIGVNHAAGAMKFVNQTGDFAMIALKRLSKGGALTEEDRKMVQTLTETSTQMCLSLRELAEAFSMGRLKMEADAGAVSTELDNLINPKEEYPTLLYDGPFSDSLLDRRMKGLGETEVTMEEAKRSLSEFLETDESKIRFLQETAGDETTYVFEIKENNAQAAVTRRGGKVLYVLSELSEREENTDIDKCIETAKQFVLKKGFGETHASYFRKSYGIITVNLAPVEKGIILYPDLIKIEVDMQTDRVVGLEATNYYMNHDERALPDISRLEIPEPDYEFMTVVSVRPALIPIDASEKMTYEIHVKDDNNEYLIYQDTETGDEIMLYEVVHTADGIVVQ